ncbi:hypothetical protein H6G80_30245 [Nostoc sp. FACHB-87]|uniref:hypothetical protein n=1 Tax=Nostocaceae TaxID=1162 RepID=UPI001688883C|nr:MULTISPECIES: hypothetical protein [Nostocaceae]MBD2458335.1 hypothetical protein [Nostoc sp. FACHB-87]MBD2479354.1 hypothetical protein [Anabaena sp. FACHB-83]
MALAILRFLESDGAKSRFQVDLGTNRFYTYEIGGDEVQQVHGLTKLQDPIYTSPLIGPLPEESLGRTILEVPNNKFDHQHRAIQITSFRNQQRQGPAISDIVQVTSISPAPVTSFSFATTLETAMDKQSVETVPFQYREVPPVSEAMFLGGVLNAVKSVAAPLLNAAAPVLGAVTDAVSGAPGAAGGGGIASLLSGLLPQLTGIIGGLLPQLMGGGATTAGGTAGVDPGMGQPGQSPDGAQIANVLAGLLHQVGSAAAPGQTGAAPAVAPVVNAVNAPVAQPRTPVAARRPAATPGVQPVMRRAPVAARPTMARAKSLAMSAQNYYSALGYDADAYGFSMSEEEEPEAYGFSMSSEYANSLSAEYAESMFIPAIAGILSAVGPQLLKLAPSLLSMFGPQLGNLFGSLLNPQKATSGQMSTMLGLDEHEDGEDQAVLMALSLALAASATPDLVYQRVGAVTLGFADVTLVMMRGKSRFLYRHDQDISFPLKLETPQPVRKARLQLLVKHPKTLKIVIEQNYRIESASSGVVSVVPRISKEQLKKLAPNHEYLVCVTLVWQGRSKKTKQVKRLGTSTMQLITLVGEYLFDRVEGTGQTVPLNDVERFRPYWHKVWQGDFTDDVRRMNFECKYYYVLETHRTENARMETVTQVLEEDLAGRKSRLKSGLIVSPYGLNELLGQVFNHPQLSEAELAALVSSEFKGRFSHAARTEVKFSGKPRQTVALWVYPEFKLQQVFLKQVDQSNGNGHVLALKEHLVYFPMPAVAHFIGVNT